MTVSYIVVLDVLQVMIPMNYKEFIDDLTFQVKNNIIPMSRIDDAVKRILRVKFVMGLFENPMADLSLVNYLGSKVHHSYLYIYLFIYLLLEWQKAIGYFNVMFSVKCVSLTSLT